MKNNNWYCDVCTAQNSVIDGECQWCVCRGVDCKRSNCSQPEHFHADHVKENERQHNCAACISTILEDGKD